jgi:deazaflavin-dependent oxidoreductase (nitroreductase family)
MRLTTIGRRTGNPRSVILAYFQDGANLVTLAMNGWAEAEPAWWLNLQAQPSATVELKDGRRAVRGRAAVRDERARLWARWRELGDDVDGYATRRPRQNGRGRPGARVVGSRSRTGQSHHQLDEGPRTRCASVAGHGCSSRSADPKG